jgi:hypothetical protein
MSAFWATANCSVGSGSDQVEIDCGVISPSYYCTPASRLRWKLSSTYFWQTPTNAVNACELPIWQLRM